MARFVLRVNGRTHEVEGEADDSLLSVLRYELNLTGSKFGCGEGHCGACTVLIDGQATRSCVARTRRRGAASRSRRSKRSATADKLHPVQQAFLDAEAFQCGYCTPGMVMATIGLLRDHAESVRGGHRAADGSQRLPLRHVSAHRAGDQARRERIAR